MFKLAAVAVGLVGAGAGAWLVLGGGSLCCDDPPCCEAGEAPAGEPQKVTTLDATLGPLRDDFNAHADAWRAVLLVSPVCSECVLGARAVEKEIMARYPSEKVHASVAWIPMLKGDTEEAARQSSGILARANAAHFYDAKQAAGWAFHRGPFKGMAERVKKSLPADHWIAEAWAEARHDTPQWDLYMLYAPGVKWEADAPPTPTAWIRHIGRHGDEGKSVYWRDTPDTPPREGDLYEAMRAMADETIGKPVGAAPASVPTIELLGFPGCPNMSMLRDSLRAALAATGGGGAFTEVNLRALPTDDARRGWPSPTILVNGRDLFGLPAPEYAEMACRDYPGGVPSADAIKARLESARR